MRRFSQFLLAMRWRQATLCALACALLLTSLRGWGWLDGVRLANYDFLMRSRGPLPPHPKIILLVIDDDTIATYQQWPPPRHIYADIVRRLHQYGAKTVVFDVLFATHSVPQQDQMLIAACRQAGNVVHAVSFTRDDQADPYSRIQAYNKSQSIAPAPRFQVSTEAPLAEFMSFATASRLKSRLPISALPQLQQSALGLGHVNAPADTDGKLRELPHLFFTYENKGEAPQGRLTGVYPSLALAGAAAFLGLKPSDIVATPHEIRLAGRRIPVNSDGRTRVNWVGGPNSFPTFSVAAFLGKISLDKQGRPLAVVPPSAFKDSLVVVGFTAAGAYEHRATPFAPQQAAMEMQASAIDNILTNRFLHEAPAWVPLLLLFLLCWLGSLAIVWRGALVGTLSTLGASVLLWVLALLLMRRFNFYLPVAVPALSGAITCAVFTLYLQLQDAFNLKMAEERYALAVNGANDGLWDWNLITREIYFSPRWKSVLGCAEHEIGNSWHDWSRRIHPDDLEQVKLEIKAHLKGQSPHFENEHRILHRDGTYRWVLSRGLAVRNDQGRPTRMAGSMSDIHDRKVAEEQIRHDAIHDGLTELPNRTLFHDRLSQALQRANGRTDYQFAVLFLDLDRFKVVNDSLGHSMGDELLKEVSRRLQECLRPGDTAARLGGDEFTVLLENLRHPSEASRIAEQIQQELSRPFLLHEVNGAQHEVFVTASIGIAINKSAETYVPAPTDKGDDETETPVEIDEAGELIEAVVAGDESSSEAPNEAPDEAPADGPAALDGAPRDGAPSTRSTGAALANASPGAGGAAPVYTSYRDPVELLRDADTAMYRAKSLGPARHAVFDEAMHSKAMTLLRLQTDLRHAVEREEFEPYYQPIVSLETGLINGFEALVRWNHPTRGFVSPAQFVPMAEETGLIVQLDQMVLRAACAEAVAWSKLAPAGVAPPAISVNLSVQQFWQADLVARVEQVLRETGLDPRLLKLEITEGAIMRNAESAIVMLRQLQNLGISLSIDDFGTGYSSLAYLQKFPLDTLKIDQSFVRCIGTEDESSEIVWTIIALARNLGMDVIAEGVETLEHLAQLKRLTCDFAQGYYFSRPVSAAEAQKMVSDLRQWEKIVLREATTQELVLDMAAELSRDNSPETGAVEVAMEALEQYTPST